MLNITYFLFIIGLIILSSPLMIGIAVAIFVFSGRPILFRQKRVGKDGKRFEILKFRTMVNGAENGKKAILPLNEAFGPVFKIHNDPRLTAIGRYLRHTGLDELPQLINVLVGDMALIGPRPLPVDEEKHLKPWMRERQTIKPGIISPWILNGYHKQTFECWMKSDIEYAHHKSFPGDCLLALRTVGFLLSLLTKELSGGSSR